MMAIQMPNLTSYSGSWLMWYSDRTAREVGLAPVSPPVAHRKVDPKYVARRPQGRAHRKCKVQLACVISKDGFQAISNVEVVRGTRRSPQPDRRRGTGKMGVHAGHSGTANRWYFCGRVGRDSFQARAAHPGALLTMRIDGRQHLIFDADDTLWENNIYFEQAFDEFCTYTESFLTQNQDEIRGILDEIERESNKIHGYGAVNFGRNLSDCYLRLAERAVEEHDLKRVSAFACTRFCCRRIHLMDGVAETLPFLAEKHELTLFTKGEPAEQNRKIDLSGLRSLFTHCEIVKEKNPGAYACLAKARDFDLERTWMIGNSPRSDINPALAAGMRAVFVPHERTWTLEREAICDVDGRLVVLNRFSDLIELFAGSEAT